MTMVKRPLSKTQLLAQERSLRELIGAQIAVLRTAHGKSNTDWRLEFPEFITSAGKLSNWENGTYLPNMLFLLRLCEVYGVSMDYFFARPQIGLEKAIRQSRRVGSD